MTERWRKRLGDLDDVSPSEDVFHRAHDGPQIPDEQIPRPSTGSRVVTGVAAFVVFALAIGVFAIPALRMNSEPGGATGVGIQPLWPARSTEDLEALQARADAGDATWATHPEAVAARFGDDVMGWNSVDVTEMTAEGVRWGIKVPCDPTPEVIPGYLGTGSPSSVFSCQGTAIATGSGGFYDPTRGSTTGPPSPYRTFVISDLTSRLLPNSTLRLYQPLEAGEGEIWAVMEVTSERSAISASPGEHLVQGDLLWANSYTDIPGAVGYGMGTGACFASGQAPLVMHPAASPDPNVDTPVPSVMYSGGDLTIEVSGRADTCPPTDAGYAWAAASFEGPVGDPFDGSSTVSLLGLTAVPVIISSDEAPRSEPTAVQTFSATETAVGQIPTKVTVPGDEDINWTTYTDELGWSIDLPTTWASSGGDGGFEATGRPLPLIQIVHDAQADPADDSTFPLDIAVSQHDVSTFRGDGLAFELIVAGSGPENSLTDREADLVQEIVASIRFERWRQGDVRNGWARLEPPAETAGWFDHGGSTFVIFHEESTVGLEVFGPLPDCAGQELSLDNGGSSVVQTCADDSTTYGPDGAGGLTEYPVVIAHDDSRIARLPG